MSGDILQPLVPLFIKFFLVMVGFAVIFGIFVGLISYGRPRKKLRNPGVLELIILMVETMVHSLIDVIRGKMHEKRNGSNNVWLNDQQLLFALKSVSPTRFEELIAEMFQKLGYSTTLVGGKSDGGIDVEMIKDGRHFVVQCKKFITQKVSPSEVRDFFGAMGARGVNGKGFFVTTNIFTFEAEQFADGKPIELIDGQKLIGMIRKSGVVVEREISDNNSENSFDTNISEKCPRCNSSLVERKNRKDGTSFLGCSGYPRCRFIKKL